MRFISLPDNPMPEGLEARTVTTEDGVSLRAGLVRPAGPVRGTVALLQGRAETIEKYYEVIGELAARGFVVAALDWRGQGGSDRGLRNPLKGHVDDFADYDRDLAAFTAALLGPETPEPRFALAHSTGALILLRALRSPAPVFARVLLTAPLIALGSMNPPGWFVDGLSGLLTAAGLGDFYPPGASLVRVEERSFEGNPLTGDARRFSRMLAIVRERPDLALGPPTIGWLHAACAAMRETSRPAFAAAIATPVLAVSAGADRVVKPVATERLIRRIRLGRQVVIPGARHEILMERDAVRAAFWAAFDAFIPGA